MTATNDSFQQRKRHFKKNMFWRIFNRHKSSKNWAIPGLFSFIFVISIQLIVHINFSDDWIRTADLWCQKQPLYQLGHNHFPTGTKNGRPLIDQKAC